MKWLVLLLLICVSCVAYRAHVQSVEAAETAAREAAREAALEEGRVRAEQERARAAAYAAARRPLMAISKVLEPLLISVQAPLDEREPADLVPMIEVTKQRILDKRVHAEAERQVIFDRATAVMDLLTAVAEERTNFLVAMLRNRANASTSLDRPNSGTTASFFSQNTAKRWNDTVTRTRPTVLQAMEQLRAAERQWNKQLDLNRETENYEVGGFAPLLIPAEQAVQNSLSTTPRTASAATPASGRIWRTPYYTMYGYRYPTYPVFP